MFSYLCCFLLGELLNTKFKFLCISKQGEKRKVFYGQEPPSGESTTTECGVNYQLLAVMY